MKSLLFCCQKAIKATKFVSTKEASDLVDQEVQDMLRKGAVVVSDPKEDQFLSSWPSHDLQKLWCHDEY